MINLVGGALCLDFANTVEGREGPERRDAMRAPRDLLLWGRRAGIVPEERGGAVPPATALAGPFEQALELREAIYRVFTAIVRGQAPGPVDLDLLQSTLVEGLASARLAPDDTAPDRPYAWRWEERGVPGDPARAIDVLRWRASQSAVDLLLRGRLERVRQCPGGGEGPCNWLFIDTTKGGNRRWCSMADCGGRAKWRRQNARRRKR